MNSNNKQKICIEVLADDNIENLTDEIQTAIRNAAGLDSDADISDAVSAVVTGVSPKAARGIVQHAVSEAGLSTDWNSDEYQVVEPNVEKTMGFLDEKNYESFNDPENSMSRDAFRKAANFRARMLVEGTDNHAPIDQFILIHDEDGANSSARAFADNVLEHGGILMQHPVAGVPQDNDEPADAEVQDEFEGLIEA